MSGYFPFARKANLYDVVTSNIEEVLQKAPIIDCNSKVHLGLKQK